MRARSLLLALLVFASTLACDHVTAKAKGRRGPVTHGELERLRASPLGAREHERLRVVGFEGMCDASGAVRLDARHMLVIDDEDNRLRIYDVERGGAPSAVLTPNLGLAYPEPDAEADLEAAARLGEHAYFLASHGRTNKGKRDPNRLLFFATHIPEANARSGTIAVVGSPYRALLDDLARDEKLSALRLGEAALYAPKELGGLNLEGLTSDPDGKGLWLGFRNPIPGRRALLVRLENPRELTEGRAARFSEPRLVDLDGLGVRALGVWRSEVLVLAGPSGEGGPFRLFRLAGETATELVPDLDLTGFGPEGFFATTSGDELLLLSDDGARHVDGKACKKLKQASAKSFRGLWLSIGAGPQVVRR